MSSSHHDMDAETNRTSRHSPDLSRSEESSNTALPLKNIAKSGAGANICQVFAIVLLLLLTLAQKWEIMWTEEDNFDFEKLIIKTDVLGWKRILNLIVCVMYISIYFVSWSFPDLTCYTHKKGNTRNMETWSDLIVMCRCSTKWGLKQSSTLVSCQASGTKHLHRERGVTNIWYGELEIKTHHRQQNSNYNFYINGED